MICVLDASAGIEIGLNKEKSGVFSQALLTAEKVISSDLYKAETTNVLWKYCHAKLLSKDTAFTVLRHCENLVDEFVDLSLNSEESLAESIRLGHPSYDFFYLTIARRCGGVLLSMDKKLQHLAAEIGVEIM